jgi:hypothetical protein
MATRKMLTRDLPLCFVAQFAFPKEKKSICQFTNTGVTIVGRSLNFFWSKGRRPLSLKHGKMDEKDGQRDGRGYG